MTMVYTQMHRTTVQGSLQRTPASCIGSTLNVRLAAQPATLQRQPQRAHRGCNKVSRRPVSAAAEDDSEGRDVVDVQKIGVIPFSTDEETLVEVMAFAGPAPERTNGRIAMIAFVGAAAAEAATGKTVVDQAADAPILVLFAVFLISVASIFPKFAAGVPLAKLIESTGREGMPKELAFFNKTHEIWLGRVAMVGFLGLVAVEGMKGSALF